MQIEVIGVPATVHVIGNAVKVVVGRKPLLEFEQRFDSAEEAMEFKSLIPTDTTL